MTSKLRLLLDEDVQKFLADEVQKWNALNVELVGQIPSLKGQDDPVVIAYARSQRRIVVTLDTHMTEHRYEICTHPGIVLVAVRQGDDARIEAFRKLMRSGHRGRCRHAVTYLHRHGATFKIKDRDGRRADITLAFKGKDPVVFPQTMDCSEG